MKKPPAPTGPPRRVTNVDTTFKLREIDREHPVIEMYDLIKSYYRGELENVPQDQILVAKRGGNPYDPLFWTGTKQDLAEMLEFERRFEEHMALNQWKADYRNNIKNCY